MASCGRWLARAQAAPGRPCQPRRRPGSYGSRFASGFPPFSRLSLQLPQLRKSSEVMESWGCAPSPGLGRMAAKT